MKRSMDIVFYILYCNSFMYDKRFNTYKLSQKNNTKVFGD